ncbi:MAG: helix-turn-helix domain-containing protein [Pseudomonadota bacterium]
MMYSAAVSRQSATMEVHGGLWDDILTGGMVELTLGTGEPLFCEGDEADFVYEVTAGVVCSYTLLPDGRRQVTGFAYAGDIVGLGHHETHQTNCDAIGEARVRSIPRSRLMKVANERPQFGMRLLECASSQLAGMQDHFMLLGRKCAQEKLASFLLALARRFGGTDAAEARFDLPMTRGDIADYLGLTIETVSRSFTKLKRAGIVDLPQSSTVHVRDMMALEDAAEAEK